MGSERVKRDRTVRTGGRAKCGAYGFVDRLVRVCAAAAAAAAEQVNAAVEVKSALTKVRAKLRETADKPLVDFHQLRNEVKFTLEAQEDASERLEGLLDVAKKLYDQNLVRTKLTEETLTEVDSKMMIRKLNEIRSWILRSFARHSLTNTLTLSSMFLYISRKSKLA